MGAAAAQRTWASYSRSDFLDTTTYGIRGFQIKGTPLSGNFLQLVVTQTNGTQSTFSVTNGFGLTLEQMTQRLLDLINTNTNPSLQGTDGLAGEVLVSGQIAMLPAAEGYIRELSIGRGAPQHQVAR